MFDDSRTDNLSPEDRLRTMRSVRSRDTTPEKIVRQTAFRLGFRYRLNRKDLPGRPDLVFVKKRKVIFVHGCFWHGHDCKAGIKRPKANSDYWTKKLQRNKERDALNYQRLTDQGWDFQIVWECELRDVQALEARLTAFLEETRDGISASLL